MKNPQDRRIEPRKGRKLLFYEPIDTSYLEEGGTADEESQGLPASQWAVQWGDLMMTMFVLFAMLYAYHLSERDTREAFQTNRPEGTQNERNIGNLSKNTKLPKGVDSNGNSVPPADPNGVTTPGDVGLTPEQILELSERAIKETNINDVDVVLQDDKTIKISLSGPLLFDLGSTELREETVGFLQKVALVLARTNNEVHVVGHTDNFPIHSDLFPTNWELSVVRASRVARYLILQGPLEPGRFTVMGHSYYRPVEPNTSLENKQKNRRVEIIITRKIYKETKNS